MKCHYFNSLKCRSCNLLDLPYAETIQKKENELVKIFNGFDLNLLDSCVLDQVELSRNKAKLAVTQINDEYFFGYFDRDQKFIELENCPLHMDGINSILNSIKELLKKFNIPAYSLESKRGELKYLLISKSFATNEILIRFVLRSKESLDRLRKMIPNLIIADSNISVVSANIQPDHKAIFEGDEEIVLTEKKATLHKYEEVSLYLASRSFFQVTPLMAQKLYSTIGQKVKELKLDSMLDLYCGVGAFSFFASQSAKNVIGIEISEDAIELAKMAKNLNNIAGSLDFYAEDAEKFLDRFNGNFDAILVNPPRRGLNSQITRRLKSLKPKYIFYSSCNFLTLKRDLDELQNFYQVQSTQIFDMFPYTDHFETLMILKLKE